MFRVERVVAEGGFAVVYQAHHEGFRAKVALKCLKVPDAMTEQQRAVFLERFREEGELLFRLSALVPAVVRPLHVDVAMVGRPLVPFLALEWLEGEALDQLVETRRAQGKPPIEIRKLTAFLQPAAQGLLAGAPGAGADGAVAVIHRDIKPENIFVAQTPGGEVVKILDFGIARTRSAATLDAGAIAQSGAVDAFTPGYAAPEQWRPRRYGQVGPWTDVFSLALTMVEVLAGRPAIDGDLGTMRDLTTHPERRPTPRALGVTVPDAVERAFARALAVDPRDRTPSIAGFWTEVEAALGLPPSIHLAEERGAGRTLTGTSEPPPPPSPTLLPLLPGCAGRTPIRGHGARPCPRRRPSPSSWPSRPCPCNRAHPRRRSGTMGPTPQNPSRSRLLPSALPRRPGLLPASPPPHPSSPRSPGRAHRRGRPCAISRRSASTCACQSVWSSPPPG